MKHCYNTVEVYSKPLAKISRIPFTVKRMVSVRSLQTGDILDGIVYFRLGNEGKVCRTKNGKFFHATINKPLKLGKLKGGKTKRFWLKYVFDGYSHDGLVSFLGYTK